MEEIKELALITNTHSVNSYLWECHFAQLRKYLSLPLYVFSDIPVPIDGVKTLVYNAEDKFRTQYLSCLKHIKEEYCL